MSASLSLLFRILLAWTVALIVAAIIWSEIFGSTGSIFALVAIFLLVVAVTSTLSHLRRVNLLAGRLDRDSLASRQRRQRFQQHIIGRARSFRYQCYHVNTAIDLARFQVG